MKEIKPKVYQKQHSFQDFQSRKKIVLSNIRVQEIHRIKEKKIRVNKNNVQQF